MTLFCRNTLDQRYDFISRQIYYNTHIIDFCCGKGFYVKKLISKLRSNMHYFAHDINPEEL
jgi:ubiquinone/menaquinone biosynthesis C-methylase UbiE